MVFSCSLLKDLDLITNLKRSNTWPILLRTSVLYIFCWYNSNTRVTLNFQLYKFIATQENWFSVQSPFLKPDHTQSALVRCLVATAAVAPVRMFVIHVPSIKAMGNPVSGSTSSIIPITAGKPCSLGFSGWTFRHFTPALFRPSINRALSWSLHTWKKR